MKVPMQEIVPKFKISTPSSEKKKTMKKVEKEEVRDTRIAAAGATKPGSFSKSSLGIKLHHKEVV